MERRAVILGATGTVGRGIVRALAAGGWSLLAVARDASRLDRLAREMAGVEPLAGSVAGEDEAAALASTIRARGFAPDAIIASVNRPRQAARLLDLDADGLSTALRDNVLTHHVAARALLPLLGAGGRYVGIGGGMADLIFDGMGAISLGQAALRNMYRFYARETGADGPTVAELILYSTIVDPVDDATADPRSLRADEVGAHVRAILEQPELFPGPILTLKSRRQVGLPERPGG